MPENDIYRLRDQVARAFAQTLETLLGVTVTAAPEGDREMVEGRASAILWQQGLSIFPEPAIWVYAPEETWKGITSSVLRSAGLGTLEEDDQRSTWSEVIQQSLSAFAAALTSELRREIVLKNGMQVLEPAPAATRWWGILLGTGTEQWRMDLAFAANLMTVYDPVALEQVLDTPQKPSRAGLSKTFDLLLDVPLPVSVSFGKTSLQLREVLKLNTGSIVELDRFVSEPVEVIVNDCVIARGDVVVVDGNYGVRIRQLASREDRLRSGFHELGAVTSRKP